MNKVILLGRITKDIELKQTSKQIPYCSFSLAVERKYKDANNQKQTDFISCVAWNNTASFLSSYFGKGSKISIVGSLQSRSYDDANGQKKYVTEVLVEEIEFVEKHSNSNSSNQNNAFSDNNFDMPFS